jgi:hypothetical protein
MNKNKLLRVIGNFAVLVSFVFICKNLASLDIDRNFFFTANMAFHISWISFLFGVYLFSYLPWRIFLKVITHHKIPFLETAWVFNKANLMKYLPGNFFQFIGRNEIATRLNISHADVAFATVCDTVLLMLSVSVVSILLDWRGIEKWLGKYGFSSFKFFLALTIVMGAVLAILKVRHRDILFKIAAKLKVFFTLRSFTALLACFFYFMLTCLIASSLFLVVLTNIMHINIESHMIPTVLNAYLISWVAGFVVPGSPGGIGIREATLTLLLTDVVPIEKTLLAVVIFRLITTIGDFLGVLFAWIGIKIYGTQNPSNYR